MRQWSSRSCRTLLLLSLGACDLAPTGNTSVSRNLRDLCLWEAVEVQVGFAPSASLLTRADTIWATLRFSPIAQRNPTGPTGCRTTGTVTATSLLPFGIGGAMPQGTFQSTSVDDPRLAPDSIGVTVQFAGPGSLHVLFGIDGSDRGVWYAVRDSLLAEGLMARWR